MQVGFGYLANFGAESALSGRWLSLHEIDRFQEIAKVRLTVEMGRFADGSLTTGEVAEDQISVASDSERASSTSTPKYRTVFSILLWPSKI
ncbi:MAG: hypothetical protein JWP26_3550 [Devosia sp.]|nr:hypothetical protein [Devosia sp.]